MESGKTMTKKPYVFKPLTPWTKVEVVWEDHYSEYGDQMLADFENIKRVYRTSIGYVVKDTEKMLVVCGTDDRLNHTSTSLCDALVILKAVIVGKPTILAPKDDAKTK